MYRVQKYTRSIVVSFLKFLATVWWPGYLYSWIRNEGAGGVSRKGLFLEGIIHRVPGKKKVRGIFQDGCQGQKLTWIQGEAWGGEQVFPLPRFERVIAERKIQTIFLNRFTLFFVSFFSFFPSIFLGIQPTDRIISQRVSRCQIFNLLFQTWKNYYRIVYLKKKIVWKIFVFLSRKYGIILYFNCYYCKTISFVISKIYVLSKISLKSARTI